MGHTGIHSNSCPGGVNTDIITLNRFTNYSALGTNSLEPCEIRQFGHRLAVFCLDEMIEMVDSLAKNEEFTTPCGPGCRNSELDVSRRVCGCIVVAT